MKFKTIFFFVTISTSLVSCEGQTDRVRLIENRTSGRINVYAVGSSLSKLEKNLKLYNK